MSFVAPRISGAVELSPSGYFQSWGSKAAARIIHTAAINTHGCRDPAVQIQKRALDAAATSEYWLETNREKNGRLASSESGKEREIGWQQIGREGAEVTCILGGVKNEEQNGEVAQNGPGLVVFFGGHD